jgi:Na+/melibiose symporter-like transporter
MEEPAVLRRVLGAFRLAYLPVLVTYFAYGASAITGVALLYFQKDTLALTPAEAAHVGFWVGLPWSMKMVAGVATDRYPVLGHRRLPYLLLGALLSGAGYAALASVVTTKGAYLAATVVIAIGFMVQDVVADALSVEVARSDEERAQVQTLGRVALLAGTISVGYLGGVLARAIGPRPVCALAAGLPGLVALTALVARPAERPAPVAEGGPLAGGRAHLVMATGLGYAALGVVLRLAGATMRGDRARRLRRADQAPAARGRHLAAGSSSPPPSSSSSAPRPAPGRATATGPSTGSGSTRNSWASWRRCLPS